MDKIAWQNPWRFASEIWLTDLVENNYTYSPTVDKGTSILIRSIF